MPVGDFETEFQRPVCVPEPLCLGVGALEITEQSGHSLEEPRFGDAKAVPASSRYLSRISAADAVFGTFKMELVRRTDQLPNLVYLLRGWLTIVCRWV